MNPSPSAELPPLTENFSCIEDTTLRLQFDFRKRNSICIVVSEEGKSEANSICIETIA